MKNILVDIVLFISPELYFIAHCPDVIILVGDHVIVLSFAS